MRAPEEQSADTLEVRKLEFLFSLRHRSRLDQIEGALGALGKRLHVESRNVA